jgi:hypothetical protein
MDDELVTIRTYTVPVYAEADRMHLEAEGIPAFIMDGNTVLADYFLGNAIGYVKLQVPRSRTEEAFAVVNRHRSEPYAFQKDPDLDEGIRCLACGERMLKDEIQCPACGWSYADTAEEAPAE